MRNDIATGFKGSDDIGDVLPEVETDTTKEQLEILKDFYHSVCSSASMDDVNDALAECTEASRGVA